MNIKTLSIIFLLLLLFFRLILYKTENFNYLAYYDQKDFYTRFLDRFHGMNPNRYFVYDKYGRKYLFDYKSNPIKYNNLGRYFHKIPHNLAVIKV